ncbi:hypothetical protein Q3G72_026894 [Acer saccharum]|nr:hypothetical protein Q3G72_026894 [Acer saccharum]
MEKWSVVHCFDKKPIWFNFTGVALDFWNEAFLKKLGSMIDVYVLVDEDTLLRKRLDMARILLLVSPNKVHPEKIKVVYGRRNFYVTVETEPSPRDSLWIEDILGLNQDVEFQVEGTPSMVEENPVTNPASKLGKWK